MAKYFGHRSRYEETGKKRSKSIAVFDLLYILFILLLLWIAYLLFRPNNLSFIILALVFFISGFAVYLFFKKDERTLFRWYRGLKAEDKIAGILNNLPDNYSFFEDVKIPGKNSNIDFIVVSPTRIYTIEVKSRRGNINSKDDLTDQFVRQAFSEAISLHNYLLEKCSVDIFVTSVLVFANFVTITTPQPYNHVYIKHHSNFLPFITSDSGPAYPIQKKVIEEKIKEILQK